MTEQKLEAAEVIVKKIGGIILGIWCAFTSFVTPLWLTWMFVTITGRIYEYDHTFDEGTAEIIGVILLTA